MKYFFDTEFLEGTQEKRFLGFRYGDTKNTIDLISIGIVDSFGREYYAVSKEFNLWEAWNRYQLEINKQYPMGPENLKVYWIRENVLKPIFKEFIASEEKYNEKHYDYEVDIDKEFTYNNFKLLLALQGETREGIAKGIIAFTSGEARSKIVCSAGEEHGSVLYYVKDSPEIQKFRDQHPGYTETIGGPDIHFYAYYADYDWVVFCWIFGKMIDLPKGFPMYCRDLKQMMDEKALSYFDDQQTTVKHVINGWKRFTDFPTQFNLHNALEDANWNKKLYAFLMTVHYEKTIYKVKEQNQTL